MQQANSNKRWKRLAANFHSPSNQVRASGIILFFCLGTLLFIPCDWLWAEKLVQRFAPPYSPPKVGQYALMENRGTYTLLHLKEYNAQHAVCGIEEIVLPGLLVGENWKVQEWYDKKAPGATQWSYYQIDLVEGTLLGAYSLLGETVVPLEEENEVFLKRLFSLTFTNVPLKEWRKSGPPPRRQEDDHRLAWGPNLYWENNFISDAQFDLWRTSFSIKEESETTIKLEVYFVRHPHSFPSYFPAYLSVQHGGFSTQFRTLHFGEIKSK